MKIVIPSTTATTKCGTWTMSMLIFQKVCNTLLLSEIHDDDDSLLLTKFMFAHILFCFENRGFHKVSCEWKRKSDSDNNFFKIIFSFFLYRHFAYALQLFDYRTNKINIDIQAKIFRWKQKYCLCTAQGFVWRKNHNLNTAADKFQRYFLFEIGLSENK